MGDFIKQWWVECALGVAVGAMGAFYKRQSSQNAAVRAGVRALLRDRIIHAYNQCEAEQCCPIYRLESIEDMYQQYHALGGNGAVTELIERVKDFPTKPKC